MNKVFFLTCAVGILLAWGHTTLGQTTEFTYQGRLLSGGVPANGGHDFEFRLFADASGDTQVGPSIPLSAVNVNNGVFSVRLDFGNQFPGANRFLEIRVRVTADQFFTVLAPRQAITSAPYAIKSLNSENANNSDNSATATNALQLNGLPANQYALTDDARLSDARNPLPNSANYIQNSTSPQAASNFNVSGRGTVGGTLSGNIVDTATQFNIRGTRILGVAGEFSTFAGFTAGMSNTFGDANSFFGAGAGSSNTEGWGNSFFGKDAGAYNTTAGNNSFFGQAAGLLNTNGGGNSFFGESAGFSNTTGSVNAFFGQIAGYSNTTGGANSFFGLYAGKRNTVGNNNTVIVSGADVAAGDLDFATTLGPSSHVSGKVILWCSEPSPTSTCRLTPMSASAPVRRHKDFTFASTTETFSLAEPVAVPASPESDSAQACPAARTIRCSEMAPIR